MFLTLTSTAAHAADLGYLLHKHPDRAQEVELPFGVARVFYPEASEDRCTVALLVEIDAVDLARRRRKADHGTLASYVNDRPYAASSLLAVALAKVFRTAMSGICTPRPELVDQAIPLTVHIPALPAPGGADRLEALFAPLGWNVDATAIPLDPTVPAWGASRFRDVTLTGTLRLADALTHLYVLLPVLDGTKHYWVGSDEIDKLLRRGGSWLAGHPEREWITRRYLAHRREFVDDALERLAGLDETPPAAEETANGEPTGDDDPAVEATRPVPLVRHRKDAVLAALKDTGAHRVIDYGCGSGSLLAELLRDPGFTEVVGADVSASALGQAERRLRLDRKPDSVVSRLKLIQSSVTYRDARLADYDAVVLMEVIEHLDPERLPAVERSVFRYAAPRVVVVTTPNAEYNVRYEGLPEGSLRHTDHRFEWTRGEFETWAAHVAERNGFTVEFRPVGDIDSEVGPPTQLALFTKAGVA